MTRTILAFVLGIAIGLYCTGWRAWGGNVTTTSASGECQISVHTMADAPGVFHC